MSRGHHSEPWGSRGIELLPHPRRPLDWIGVLRMLHCLLGSAATARIYPDRGSAPLVTLAGSLGVFDPFSVTDGPLLLELGGGLIPVDRTAIRAAACWVEDLGGCPRPVLEIELEDCLIEIERSAETVEGDERCP